MIGKVTVTSPNPPCKGCGGMGGYHGNGCPEVVPAADILGNEVAKTLEALYKDVEAARKRTQNLLKQVGRPAVCRGPNCGKGLWMVKLNSGSSMPYDPDGVPHWATCVDAEMFKKEKQHAR